MVKKIKLKTGKKQRGSISRLKVRKAVREVFNLGTKKGKSLKLTYFRDFFRFSTISA